MFRPNLHAMGLALALSVSAAPFGGAAMAQSFAPVAIVNDQVITGYDVEQRALLNSITRGGSADTAAALTELIEDTLRLQAARRSGVDPTPEQVRAGFDEISRINRRDPAQMRSGLLSRGISSEALDAQVKAEVAWRQYIIQRYGARAAPTERDVEQMMPQESGAAPGETEYRLSELRFPIGADGEAAAMQRAQQAIAAMKTGQRFSEVARERSSGPTAATGGELGWVARSGLSPAGAQAVSSMNNDRASAPFVDGDEVVVYGLRDTREAGGGETTIYTLAQLVVGVQPNATQATADAALAQANAVRAEISTCADVEARSSQYLPISGSLGELRLEAMPGPVREAVAGLDTGQITQPVRSNDGFHVIVVCDKTSTGPTRDTRRAQATGQLRAERLERYAKSLLRELKREAVIERR